MSDEELYAQYMKETGQEAPVAAATETPEAKRSRVMGEINHQIDDTDYGAAMANALSAGGGASLSKAVPKLSGLVGSTLEGGAMGAAQAPSDDRLAGFLKGGAIQGGLGVLGKMAGGLGDRLMQVAVGRKKYTPGVGTTLADQNLIGTKKMMAGQTEQGLTDAYEQMLKSAEGAAPIDSRSIGNEVYNDYTSPMTGRGRMIPSSSDVPRINQAQEFADDIRSRGQEPATIALERRKAAGKRAYSEKQESVAKSTPIGDLSKREQIKYSQALKDADPTGQMAVADTKYAALKRAERGLNEEAPLPKSIMGAMSYGADKLPGGALATSVAGQAGVKGGRLAQFLAPLARQAAVGGSREPSAQEFADYQQYLKETGQAQ